ncbi:unnamed protein product [Protopolystoma xenopodis]|uniref:Helicase C-terminal domain-containing protein n=1 Tax=Protopolystoma xenopodis TaxID=117903 RepID=A0A448WX07_9PLAT|nr:unnamed protein product [Protopolystoma xenopodis]
MGLPDDARRTRLEARWLKNKMELGGHKVALLTGELDVAEREAVITDFRRASVRVLITTNLCARDPPAL